jgi:hypothetical protein
MPIVIACETSLCDDGIAFANPPLVTVFIFANNVDSAISRWQFMQIAKKIRRSPRVMHDNATIFYSTKENVMGKYFIAWLLGVPAGLLVLVYVFMHVF